MNKFNKVAQLSLFALLAICALSPAFGMESGESSTTRATSTISQQMGQTAQSSTTATDEEAYFSAAEDVPLYSTLPPKYSINLEWINPAYNEDQRSIYPADGEKADTEFFDKIISFAVKNHLAIIKVWYDSAMTSKEAVINTERKLIKRSLAHKKIAPIELKDVRTLPEVQYFHELFSSDMPIFYRVDLLRILFLDHCIATDNDPYAVYQDLDMAPLSEEELFDPETIRNLSIDKGIVLGMDCSKKEKTTPFSAENSFIIVSQHARQEGFLRRVFTIARQNGEAARRGELNYGIFGGTPPHDIDEWGKRMWFLPETVYENMCLFEGCVIVDHPVKRVKLCKRIVNNYRVDNYFKPKGASAGAQ